MHLNKLRLGLAVTAGAMAMASAYAANVESVTFNNFNPAMTSTPTAGTLLQWTVGGGYNMGRIRYTGDTTEINGVTGDWVADNAMYSVFPGGAPAFDKNPISPITGYVGTQTFDGDFLINAGAAVPVSGVFKFYVRNTFDDSPAGIDSVMNLTINITDEDTGGPTPPANTNVGSVTPGVVADTTAALNISSGGVAWFKFTVTTASDNAGAKTLDITTNGSGQDLDFVLYDSAGTFMIYRDGSSPLWEPWMSFGGVGIDRPAPGGETLNGSDGQIAPGVYYLACGRYYMGSSTSPWVATSTGSGAYAGSVKFHTDLLAPPPPPPTPIYEQLIHTAGAAGGDGLSVLRGSFDGGFTNYDRMAADEFTATGTWNVTGVSGSFINQGGLTPTNVEVVFYQQTGTGEPGAVIASYDRPWSAVTLYSEGTYFGYPTKRYLVDLGGTEVFAAGTYCVMVRPYAATGNNFFWMTSDPTYPITGNPAYYQAGPNTLGVDATWPFTWTQTGMGGIFTTPHDFAYALYGSIGGGNTVTGTVDFGNVGPTYNSGPFPGSIPVSFRDAANNEIATGSASYNAVTGAFSASVPGAVTVPYRVSFKLGFWLRKTLPNPADPAAPLGNYNFGTVAPAVGDADDDNEITNADYSIWAFGNGNSVAPNTDADFDGDGEITNSDYALWAGNNGLSGDN